VSRLLQLLRNSYKRGRMNKKGFTIVELMVAIIILSIFLLSVGMILTSSVRFWNSGWDQVGVQQDASYAFARIEKIVRSGSSAVVLDGGSGLRVTADGTTYTFQLSGDVLQLVMGGNTADLVGGVQSVNFAIPEEGMVSVSLTLINNDAEANFRTTVLLRN